MKRVLSLILMLGILLSLAACGGAPAQESSAPSATQQAASQTVPQTSPQTEASHYPISLTDQAGRTVTLEKEPVRIVSGYYISTSVLIALELEDALVGIEAKAGSRPIYRLSAPELMDLPNVGSAKEFDLEGCAALEPDLAILPVKLKSAAETLEGLGIPVLLVNPENQAQLREMVSLLAAAIHREERGDALLAFAQAQEAFLQEQLAGLEKPTVYLAGNSGLLSTAGDAMYQSDLIRLAGGENVASALADAYWAEVSYEQLLAWDPQYILLASDAGYTPEDVLADPNLAACTAVVNGNVYQLPSKAEAWDSPVPSGILGALWLASVLHPQQLPAEQLDGIIEEYYQTFYGFSYRES